MGQPVEKLLQERQQEVNKKQQEEINHVLDSVDNDLWFFANTILRITVWKEKLHDILTHQKIENKEDFINAVFDKNSTIFGSEKLWSVVNRVWKKTLEFSNYFSDIFTLLQDKNKEILAIIDKYKKQLDDLKNEVENEQTQNNDDLHKNDENATQWNTTQWDTPWVPTKEEPKEKKSDKKKEWQENTSHHIWKVSAEAYTGIGATRYASTKISKLHINKQLKAMELSPEKQDRAINDIIQELEKRKMWKGFETTEWKVARKNIDKTIEHFKKMQQNFKKSRASLLQRKKLDSRWLLSTEAFSHFVAHPETLKNLEQITKEGKLKQLKWLLETNPQEAKKLLWIAEGIDIPKPLIKNIQKIENIKDVSKIGKVIKEAKNLSRMGKFMRAVPLLDLAFFGIDIWMWDSSTTEAQKVAEYNKARAEILKQKANAHLWIGGISTAAAATLTTVTMVLGASGPPWWIVAAAWIAIGATTYAVDSGINSMYYDIIDFYKQNTADYLQQYRIKTKQSIVAIMQSLNPNIEKSINESLFINEHDVSKKQKITSMKDAYQWLILKEEGLSLKQKDEKIVKLRMQYITANMENPEIVDACAKWDLTMISRLLALSKTYAQLMDDKAYLATQAPSSPNKASLIAYKKYCQQEAERINASSYNYLINMDETEFFQIYYIIQNNIVSKHTPDSNASHNIKLINRIATIRSFGKTQEELDSFHFHVSMSAWQDVERFLWQEIISSGINTSVRYTKEELSQDYANGNIDYYDSIELTDVSDNVSQNILYAIAKKLHGYTGKNDMTELVNFFSQWDENALWLYYNGKWLINNDWAIDRSFDPKIFADPSLSTQDIIKQLQTTHILNTGWSGIDTIDTATETADEDLNINFWTQLTRILEEERKYLKPEKKKEIQKNIREYIENNSQGKYIRLPYYLQVQSLKAWLWNCEHSFFSFQDGKIIETHPQSYSTPILDFLHIKKPFVDTKEYLHRPYDQMDKSEKEKLDKALAKLTDPVDKDINKLNHLLDDKDVGITQDYKTIINQKIQEWNQFKLWLKDYDINTIKSKVLSHYTEFNQWFDTLYINLLSWIYENTFTTDQSSLEDMNLNLLLADQNPISFNNKEVQLHFRWKTYAQKEDKKQHIESFASNDLTKKFFELYKTIPFPYQGKKLSCASLLKQWNDMRAQHYATLIRESLLELKTVDFDKDKDGNIKFHDVDSTTERWIQRNREKLLIFNPLTGIPAALFSRYKSRNEQEEEQKLFTQILTYNLKRKPYHNPELNL